VVKVVEAPTKTTTATGDTPIAGASPATTLPMNQQVSSQQIQQAIAQTESNTQDLSVPVFVDSQLPEPEPENPLVIQTGAETRLDIITINQQAIQLQDTQGFRLTISSTDAKGELAKVNAKGAIMLKRGNFLTVTGDGYKPNSMAVAWLFSQPKRLGVISVGADGVFAANLWVAEDVSSGQHTAQVNGLTIDGQVRSLNLAVEVVDDLDAISNPVDSTRKSDNRLYLQFAIAAVLIGALLYFIAIERRRRL